MFYVVKNFFNQCSLLYESAQLIVESGRLLEKAPLSAETLKEICVAELNNVKIIIQTTYKRIQMVSYDKNYK